MIACVAISAIVVSIVLVYILSFLYFYKPKNNLHTVSNTDYLKEFVEREDGSPNMERLERLIDAVLDIRKFEIELYWKRATYFWAFIALTYTGYGILEYGRNLPQAPSLEWFVSCLGLFVSVAWHLVNRGSKYWQENWENHLDLLEKNYLGSLYKTVISRPPRHRLDLWRRTRDVIVGPGAYSVSKINSFLSFFNILVWFYILVRLFGFVPARENTLIVVVTVVSIVWMIFSTKTDNDHHLDLKARRRDTQILPK